MSTRRARIKAVASLPVRRRNVEAAVSTSQVSSQNEASIKSPRTPKTFVAKIHTTNTSNNNEEPPKNVYENNLIVEAPENHSSPAPDFAVPLETSIKSNLSRTPKSNCESTVVKLNNYNSSAFPSLLYRNSPDRRCIVSPVIFSPKSNFKHFEFNIRALTPSREGEFTKSNHVTAVTDSTANRSIHEIRAATSVQKACNSDDFNPPSVPESLPEDSVMDGIVPLQPARTAPKPIDLLKNEIISENAEVLFDPIVPLPSPSKVRPKLRPVPRLNSVRRNSIQGSASESEDESRRALLSSAHTATPTRQRHDSHTSHGTAQSIVNKEVNRTRNDSVCSSVSLVTPQPTATSPLKDKHNASKTRRLEMSRRMTAMRRRREHVERDSLTMYDLIFYNPTSNPIVPDQDEVNATEANKKDEAERNAISKSVQDDPDDPDEADAAPVPQIKLGPNGEIILDEKSLVIQQTEGTRKLNAGVCREGAWGGGGGWYSRPARTADWTETETVRFYSALAAVGTDFSIMAPLFPDRTRKDLKIKFKKEEKINCRLVDKALRSRASWDVSGLQQRFSEERAAEARRNAERRERARAAHRAERQRGADARTHRLRLSRGSKAIESSVVPGANDNGISNLSADTLIEREIENRAKMKRKNNKPITPIPQITIQATPPYATLTPVSVVQNNDRLSEQIVSKDVLPAVPKNIENGSLVVLSVNDPSSPARKMLQTYISHGKGKLVPVALPQTLLNSVMSYMKKGTPKPVSMSPSAQFASPNSVDSHDSRNSVATSVTNLNSTKRQRLSSYTITQL